MILLAATISQAQVQAPGGSPVWTPEAVLITIGFGTIAILISLVGWLAKKQLNDILETIHAFSDRQSDCRETLASRFADKDETAQRLKELSHMTDRHGKLLERHSVLIGRRRVGDVE